MGLDFAPSGRELLAWGGAQRNPKNRRPINDLSPGGTTDATRSAAPPGLSIFGQSLSGGSVRSAHSTPG